MAMLLGTKGNEILEWRGSAGVVAALEERLAEKWARSSGAEVASFLAAFIEALREEEGYEARLGSESLLLAQALEGADPAELELLAARYRELASAHFVRRQSVLALCELCGRLHDRLLARALALAEERMLRLGQGKPPFYALLVSGDRGRGEETLLGENRYFLLHEWEDGGSFLFSRQLTGSLRECGLLKGEQMFWHGSLGEWRALIEGSRPVEGKSPPPLPPFAAPLREAPQQVPEWSWRLEALADLDCAAGAEALGSEALRSAARALEQERESPHFLQQARRVIALPLALGRFGGLRLQRGGEHQGELNLEELALGPLLMTVRVLALHAGIQRRGTVERIRELLERGPLSVELAERLFRAYQSLMRLRILGEIRNGGGSFLDPGEFDEEEEAGFRGALEAVLNLQKIAYQRMVGQG